MKYKIEKSCVSILLIIAMIIPMFSGYGQIVRANYEEMPANDMFVQTTDSAADFRALGEFPEGYVPAEPPPTFIYDDIPKGGGVEGQEGIYTPEQGDITQKGAETPVEFSPSEYEPFEVSEALTATIQEITRILQPETYFSMLTEDDITFICENLNVNRNTLELLETIGLVLGDSILYAQIEFAYGFSAERLVQMYPTAESCTELISEMKTYMAGVRQELIGTQLDSTFREYILNGFTFEEIKTAYGVSRAIGAEMSALLTKDDNGAEITEKRATDTANRDGEIFSSELEVYEEPLREYAAKKGIDLNEAESTEIENEIQQYIAEISENAQKEGATADAATSGTSTDISKYTSAPYTYDYSETEAVNLNTGALVYENIDAVIPGANGLDLVIGRRYDSSKASISEPEMRQTMVYDCIYGYDAYLGINGYLVQLLGGGILDLLIGVEYPVMNSFVNYYLQPQFMNPRVYPNYFGYGQDLVYMHYLQTPSYYQTRPSVRPNYYQHDLYGLGYGWSFMFSSIEMSGGKQYLHLNDGRTFEIAFYTNNSNLKDYRLEDLRIVQENGAYYNGSVYSAYTLYYADGKREFFSGDGRLIGIRDRFDNTINFVHSRSGALPRIVITDTVGRVVTISGQGNNVMIVTLPDGKTLKYTVDPINTSVYSGYGSLSAYEDQMMNVTRYSYAFHAAGFDILNKNTTAYTNYYLNLMTITHPTNAQTRYDYYVTQQNLGVSGLQMCYRLATRTDYIGTASYNRMTYAYSPNTYSGYPTCYDPQNLYAGYTYFTLVTDANGVAVRHTFNNLHLKVKEETYSAYGTYNITDVEYNTYKLPSRVSEKIYSGSQYSEAIALWQYDVKGRVTSSWDAQANGSTSNTLNRTTYVYDGTYGLLLSKTYYQNSGVKIEERNTLSASRKTADYSEVYSNGISVKKQGFVYNSRGCVTAVRDYTAGSSYVETAYGYDSYCNVASVSTSGVKDADGSVITSPGFSSGTVGAKNTYDAMGRLTNTTDERGYTTKYSYNNKGDISSITNPDNSMVTYNRNYIANTLTVTNEIGTAIRYEYNQLGYETAVIDAATGQAFSRKTYDVFSNVKTEMDAVNNSTTEYAYDNLSRVTSATTKQGTATIAQKTYDYSITYDRLLRTGKTEVGDSSAPSVVTASYVNNMGFEVKGSKTLNGSEYFDTYSYDFLGNKTQWQSALDASKGRTFTTKWEYDYAGRVIRETNALNQSSYRSYDMLGRNITATDHSGNVTSFTYDVLGRMIKKDEPFEKIGSTMYYAAKKIYYDQSGNITREQTQTNKPGTAATWASVEYVYNNRGFLTNASNNGVNTSAYTYDTAGNMLTQTTGVSGGTSAVTKYTYDRFGNPLTITDPMGKVERYTYNLSGSALTKTDRNGWVTTYSYDGLGRKLTQNVNTGNATQNVAQNWTYTLTGQVRTESSGNITSTNTYDALGRVTQTSETGGVVKSYTYDIGGNRTGMVTSVNGVNRLNEAYTYDELSRLKTVSENGALQATYAYDVNGNRSSLTYANGVVTTYSYNAANLVTALQNKLGTAVQSSYSYAYCLNSMQASKADHTGRTTAYTYDGMGRLTHEAESGAADAKTYVYAYDNRSNRSSLTVSGGASYSVAYQYDLNDRLTTTTKQTGSVTEVTAYQYDNNGNTLTESVTGAGAKQYRYDGLNRQISVESGGASSSYAYRADGLRQSKTVNGVTTVHVWDGSNIALDISGSSVVKYIRGINLISSDAGGVKSYYGYNAHGDVVQLSNAAGAVTQSYRYDAFGVEQNANASDTNPFRYCGEYFDLETGTIYLRARYYQPATGRFLTEDSLRSVFSEMPNGQEIVDPLSLNLYTYCGNNPIVYHDPSGHFWETIFDIGSLIWSVVDMWNNPSWANAGFLLWDIVSLVPYIPGSYAVKGAMFVSDGIKALSKAGDYVKAGVWLQKAFDRGMAIERMLGGMANNFPVIDKFIKGTGDIAKSITSIKSLDLTAKSYNTSTTFLRTLKGYVDSLAGFTDTNWGKITVLVNESTQRILHIALPPVEMTPNQAKQFAEFMQYAKGKGIQVITTIIE